MRKWKENEEIERESGNGKRMKKWKENEEMERGRGANLALLMPK